MRIIFFHLLTNKPSGNSLNANTDAGGYVIGPKHVATNV
jgi:hypothetical protein